MPLATGKSRRDQRVIDLAHIRDVNAAIVQPCARSARAGKHLVALRIEDHSSDDLDVYKRQDQTHVAITDETPPMRLSRYGAGLNDDFSYPPATPGFIRFTQWRPDLAHFPLPIWRKLLMRRLRSATPDLFDYAEHSGGLLELRHEIAAYVARSRACLLYTSPRR